MKQEVTSIWHIDESVVHSLVLMLSIVKIPRFIFSSKIFSKCKSVWPVNVNCSIVKDYLSNQPIPEESFNCLNGWFGHYWDFDTTFGHGITESIEIGFQGWRLSLDFWQIAQVVRYRINFWAVTLICLVTKGKTKIKRLWKNRFKKIFSFPSD